MDEDDPGVVMGQQMNAKAFLRVEWMLATGQWTLVETRSDKRRTPFCVFQPGCGRCTSAIERLAGLRRERGVCY